MQHLTEEERTIIEYELNNGRSIKEIANILNRPISTISREIKRNRNIELNNKCIRLRDKEISIEEHICNILKKAPYVCNGCSRYGKGCTYDYVIYNKHISHNEYKRRINSVKLKDKSKYEEIIPEIQERLNMGQPIHHIVTTVEEAPSKTTIYNLVNKGALKYSKSKIRKKRLEKEKLEYRYRKDMLVGKTYIDFLEYIEQNPKDRIAEIDLICGDMFSKNYVLSIFIPSLQFLILKKLPNKKSISVMTALDDIERKVGYKTFKSLMGIILTDRGSEFLRYEEMMKSCTRNNMKRCKIFYCDKGSPQQKAYVENIHKMVRKYIPKGTSLDNYVQDDFNYIASNLNSLVKERYKNKTPNEMFLESYSKTILKKLSLEVIESSDICIRRYIK